MSSLTNSQLEEVLELFERGNEAMGAGTFPTNNGQIPILLQANNLLYFTDTSKGSLIEFLKGLSERLIAMMNQFY